MSRKIERVVFSHTPVPRLLNVAAYARVSSGKDEMLHSLSAQVSYYRELIESQPGWTFSGIYADEALTGTKDDRAEFQRLLAACRAGKVDMVITKSISRFARNTVTLLETVRELKALGVDVFFEEQNIHTMSSAGELMLTILGSFAQEESRSASENQKWRVRRNFEEGCPWRGHMLGYRMGDGKLEVVPEEAVIVRRIFNDYLAGNGVTLIAKHLNDDGVPNPSGAVWAATSIQKVLKNYNYTGNLLLQKTYRTDHITKKTVVNKGQLPQYLVENSHDPIVDLAVFEAVQAEMNRRAEKHCKRTGPPQTHRYTGMLECAICEKNYRRKITATQAVWICSTFNARGKRYCASKQIPETTLDLHTALVTDDFSKIEKIQVAPNNTLYYRLTDGQVVTRQWADRSRAESWTPEKREAARVKTQTRNKEARQ